MPDNIIEAQIVKETGMMFYAGGLNDQPYIWLMQITATLSQMELHEKLRKAAADANKSRV